jgi:hypothetical protein
MAMQRLFHILTKTRRLFFLFMGLSSVWAAAPELNQLPFFYGREYFILRSGQAQMIVQADRADLGPAFTYLLYDAQDARQSVSKELAFNWRGLI